MRKINLKLPVRASVWYTGASLVAKGVGFLITPFFTRMISGQAYGELTLYLTLVGIASVSCSAVNTGSAIYKGIKDFRNEKGSFLKSALLVSLSFSAAFCIVLFAFSSFWGLDDHLFILLTLQILCDSIIAIGLSSAKFSYRYKEVAFDSILSYVLPAIITLALLKTVNGRFRVRVYSLLTISIFLALWSLIKIFREGGQANKKMSVALLKSSLPLIPHSISSALSGQADKMIITYFLGAYALAKYSVTHSLGVGLQFIVSSVGFALGPWMMRKLDAKEHHNVAYLIEMLIFGVSALCICLIALAPEAMRILAPPEYLDAFPALLPIVITTPISLISSVVTICLTFLGRGKAMVNMALAGAGASLILNFTLIPKFGYLGAGLALFLSAFSSMSVGIYLLRKEKLLEILSPKKNSRKFLFTTGVSYLVFLLFEVLALRVLILIIPAVMLLNAFYNTRSLIVE